LTRLLAQFRKAYKRNDKDQCLSVTRFVAHLVNQKVAHELVALQILTLLLERFFFFFFLFFLFLFLLFSFSFSFLFFFFFFLFFFFFSFFFSFPFPFFFFLVEEDSNPNAT